MSLNYHLYGLFHSVLWIWPNSVGKRGTLWSKETVSVLTETVSCTQFLAIWLLSGLSLWNPRPAKGVEDKTPPGTGPNVIFPVVVLLASELYSHCLCPPLPPFLKVDCWYGVSFLLLLLVLQRSLVCRFPTKRCHFVLSLWYSLLNGLLCPAFFIIPGMCWTRYSISRGRLEAQ